LWSCRWRNRDFRIGYKNNEPFGEAHFAITQASEHDVHAVREMLADLNHEGVIGDKGYTGSELEADLEQYQDVNLVTPIKKKRTVPLTLFEEAFNSELSSVRQPVESFFAWVQRKTHIQNASQVRSLGGLHKHIHLRLLAAIVSLFVQF
jgi:IS5 family transposase